MSQDQIFRAVMIGMFLAVLPVGIYHRLQSQASGEKLDRRQEGTFMLATLRPLGALLWLGALAWMVDPRWMGWASMPLPARFRWVGVGVLGAGCCLLVWTFRALGKNLTDTVVTREEHTLVAHGPYRWVRHPLYAAAALMALGISVVTSNWFLFLAGAGVLCLLVIRTRIEERHLVTRFGDGYRNYMKCTGRFVPRFRRPNTDL